MATRIVPNRRGRKAPPQLNPPPPPLGVILGQFSIALALLTVTRRSLHSRELCADEDEVLGIAIERLDEAYDALDRAGGAS